MPCSFPSALCLTVFCSSVILHVFILSPCWIRFVLYLKILSNLGSLFKLYLMSSLFMVHPSAVRHTVQEFQFSRCPVFIPIYKCCSRCYAFLSSVCLGTWRLTDCAQLQNVLTGSRAPPPPVQWAAGTPSRRKSGRVVRLIRHLHLMPKLRISGSIPPLLLHAFIARIGTTLLSPFTDYFEEAHWC
jgi:hypothetical protein